MRIRTQFQILIILIVSIPLFCATFFPMYSYFTSSDRLVVKAFIQQKKQQDQSMNKSEWNELKRALRLMPRDVQAVVLERDQKVVFSTFPEIKENTYLDRGNMWILMDTTSHKYYYQYSTTSRNENAFLMITRIPRVKQERRRPGNLVPIFVSVIFVIVLALIIVVIFLSYNVFSSISVLEKQTKGVAEGDLSIKVGSEARCFKPLYHKKKPNNEITSLADSLEKMRQTLIDEQNRRLKFVMGISHDLRTPVAVIKGYTEAIADGVIDEGPEMDDALSLIQSKTNQLEDMIDTLINFMKLDVTDWRNELVDGSVTDLLIDFGKNAEITGTVFKRRIKNEVHFDQDIQVPMDRQLVSRALENLLGNAIRYTKENDEIVIKGSAEKGLITLSVSDTGCGIEQKDLDHIFELFYRGTASRREEGMGIGLSVVKTIMDTHNWKISVRSKVGEGSVFTVEIPY